jgi:hypothetical protein
MYDIFVSLSQMIWLIPPASSLPLSTRRGIVQSISSLGPRYCFWQALLPCPARRDDEPGGIVTTHRPFLSPHVSFLSNDKYRIEEVKLRGGKELFCRIMTSSNHDLMGYGKKKAANDWTTSLPLNQLLSMVIKNEPQVTKLGSNPRHRRTF